jgi:hypothetical protein
MSYFFKQVYVTVLLSDTSFTLHPAQTLPSSPAFPTDQPKNEDTPSQREIKKPNGESLLPVSGRFTSKYFIIKLHIKLNSYLTLAM